MSRSEFSATVKAAAYKRANGLCGECQQPLQPGKIEYDHILPDALGGKPELANCRPLCTGCHKIKTATQDVPRIRKADRQGRAHINAKTAPTKKIESAPFVPAPKQAKATKPIDKLAALPRRPLFQ